MIIKPPLTIIFMLLWILEQAVAVFHLAQKKWSGKCILSTDFSIFFFSHFHIYSLLMPHMMFCALTFQFLVAFGPISSASSFCWARCSPSDPVQVRKGYDFFLYGGVDLVKVVCLVSSQSG